MQTSGFHAETTLISEMSPFFSARRFIIPIESNGTWIGDRIHTDIEPKSV